MQQKLLRRGEQRGGELARRLALGLRAARVDRFRRRLTFCIVDIKGFYTLLDPIYMWAFDIL